VVRFLRARNLQGHDIYLLPYAEHRNAGYILLNLGASGEVEGLSGLCRHY
jgi:hypothetical protein